MHDPRLTQLLLIICAGLAGCVSKSTYLKQVQQTDALQKEKQAVSEEKNLLASRLSALDQNLAAAQQENEKLLGSLEAKRGELSQRVAQLTRENQDLAQSLRETEQAKEAELAKVKGTYEQLVGGLQDQIKAGQVQITQLAGRLSVNMVDKILFDSGQAVVKTEGQAVLKKIGDVLNRVQDKDIRIEGHTDNVPISGALRERFPSNWELSTARATAVVRYLHDKVGVAAGRLIAAGYGEYRPVASNEAPEGRQLNRRIDIVLVPSETPVVSTAPVQAPGTSPR